MQIFLLTAGQDTGGQSIRIKQAFDRHGGPDWSARSMHVTLSPYRYPIDLSWREPLARSLWRQSDVIHVHNTMFHYARLDDGAGKPVILHHHGTRFRTEPGPIAAEAARIGAVQLVSTIDLLGRAPNLQWLPAPFQLEALAAIRAAEYRPDDVVRIAHAPTNRAVKSTAAFLAAVEQLAERHRIEVDIIENRPWAECLRRKARADIVFDQVGFGYGNNSLEAWAMGIPVVAGVADPKARARMRTELGRDLPFYSATETTLARRLEDLVSDAELRVEYGTRGLAYMRRFHDERVVAEQLKGIYAAAPPTIGSTRRLVAVGAREVPVVARRGVANRQRIRMEQRMARLERRRLSGARSVRQAAVA